VKINNVRIVPLIMIFEFIRRLLRIFKNLKLSANKKMTRHTL
jgi:hypothetical protein